MHIIAVPSKFSPHLSTCELWAIWDLFWGKKLQIFLENHKIQTRPIFTGNILRHPAFKNLINNRNKINRFKNSDYIMRNGILIGCHQGLKKHDIKHIHSKINLFLNNYKWWTFLIMF